MKRETWRAPLFWQDAPATVILGTMVDDDDGDEEEEV